MARWRRDTTLEGLISHTDAGSQFTSIRYGEKLSDLGATPSIGSVGDAYDCEKNCGAVPSGLTLVTTGR
jgi:putative transposase